MSPTIIMRKSQYARLPLFSNPRSPEIFAAPDCPFEALGYDNGRYFYRNHFGECIDIASHPSGDVTEDTLLSLAPREFWEKHFHGDDSTGIRLDAAFSDLYRHAESRGLVEVTAEHWRADPECDRRKAQRDYAGRDRRISPQKITPVASSLVRIQNTRPQQPPQESPRDDEEHSPRRAARRSRNSQVDTLSQISARATYFHDADGVGYADVEIGGHRETWPIKSEGFKAWLRHQYYKAEDGAPSEENLKATLNGIEAAARFGWPECRVFRRVAEHDGNIYIDLCDATWRVVKITPNGWEVLDRGPARFCRTNGMRPLPLPTRGGSIEGLRPFVNAADPDVPILAVGWVLMAYCPRGPFPILAVSGEQGSAKSTLCANIRGLIDPNLAPLRALPKDEGELAIMASRSRVVGFDNVSGLSGEMSDALCKLATGSGLSRRQLYTDSDEIIYQTQAPIILNGIADVAVRGDLADRCVTLTLDPIPESARRTAADVEADFERARPAILGAIFDAVACGLRRLPSVKLATLPRMADFARWVTACEPALGWSDGSFLEAYARNRNDAVDSVIEADPVATAVRALLADDRTMRTMTSKALLADLAGHISEAVRRSRAWPSTPQILSGRLRRAAPALRKTGIQVEWTRDKGRNRDRLIQLSYLKSSSASSASSETISDQALATDDGVNSHRPQPSASIVRNVGESSDDRPQLSDDDFIFDDQTNWERVYD